MRKQVRITFLVFSFLTAVFSGWRMWNFFQDDILWGRWPLVLFISVWICLSGWFTRKNWDSSVSASERSMRKRHFGLSILSGGLLALAFPSTVEIGIPTTFLIFIGYVPLLLIENEIKEQPRAGRRLMFYAYNAFVIWNILATYWVANTAFAAGIVAVWLNAFFMAVPFWLFHKTKKFVPRLGYIAFIAYWISFEHLHLNWEISWPWLNLGNTFAEVPAWIQWYEYTGAFGGTLWVLAVNVLIYKVLSSERNGEGEAPKISVILKNRLSQLFMIAGLILLPIAFSYYIYSNYEQKGYRTEVVVVQPNFEPHYEKFNIPSRTQIKRFLRLADTAITEKTKFVVFPETSFGLVEISDFSKNREIRTIRNFLEKHPGVSIITGIDSYKIFGKDAPETKHMRTRDRGNGNVMRYEMYNGAIQIQSGREEINHYKKSKFVPGAEIFPYNKLLFFFEPLVRSLGGSVKGLGSQPIRTPFESSGVRVAPSICYESVYGQYNTGYIKQGAQATFIMTNDGWWDNTAGHRQHLKLARLRAIETRRDIARSANTGISGFINQRGDILQPTQYDEAVAVRGDIRLNDEITFYVIWGDMIARLALFTTLILLLNLFVKSRMVRRS